MRPWHTALAYWLPVLLYAAAIFINSSGPSAIDPPSYPHADKLAHLAAYALMGWLVMRSLAAALPRQPLGRLFFAAALLASLYGATDELHQGMVPSRDSSLADFAADCLGSTLGGWLWLKMMKSGKSGFRRLAGVHQKR